MWYQKTLLYASSALATLHAIKLYDRKWWPIVLTHILALYVHEMANWLNSFDCGTAFVANFNSKIAFVAIFRAHEKNHFW